MTGQLTHQSIAEDYVALWNITDPDARLAATQRLFTGDATYVDPLADVSGPAAIDAVVAAVQGQLPGLTMTLAGAVDGHHDQLRLTWELGPVAGFDVVVLDGDRIGSVYGFIDRMPA